MMHGHEATEQLHAAEKRVRTFAVEVVVNGQPLTVDAEFQEQPDGTWTNLEPIGIPVPERE